jgi:hypothetical protein
MLGLHQRLYNAALKQRIAAWEKDAYKPRLC